ncbi:MAG: sigma 54-interacting transcriptional regulator, partial [Polyangiaceae bacterium]|nr:sigma 54-interacting transcriptional regulator [Polyangiaceae bacterium]
ATHRDLRAAVSSGDFREDLLYRLEVVTLDVPPLRQRREDIPDLVEYFLAGARRRHPQSPALRVGSDAMRVLLDHRWPGNVRELEHVIERAVVLGRLREVQVADLPESLTERRAPAAPFSRDEIVSMREMQRRYAVWVFQQLGGRKMHAAEKLGVDIKTLARWLREEDERSP